jgi:cobalt-precorrin 5A hydrolase/precorrin-3B C17-methyltransferase
MNLVLPAKHIGRLEDRKIGASYTTYVDSALAEVRRCWPRYSQLILVMPAGVAVRAIAPLLGHKASDPAVICLDESGQSVIPLLGGHQAGANELARQIAAITGGHAAITTASDVQGKPALDQLGQAEGWRIDATSALTHASACLVNDEAVGVYLDPALAAIRPQVTAWLDQVDNLTSLESLDELDVDAYAAGLIISHRALGDHHQHLLRKSVLYRPQVLVAGLGCKRGVPAAELRTALEWTLAEANLAVESLAALATVDLKAGEPGLRELAEALKLPLQVVSRAQLALLEPAGFSPSAAQAKFDLPGVAEPCAVLLAGPNGQLLVPKRSFDRCTVSIALKG